MRFRKNKTENKTKNTLIAAGVIPENNGENMLYRLDHSPQAVLLQYGTTDSTRADLLEAFLHNPAFVPCITEPFVTIEEAFDRLSALTPTNNV